MNNLLILFLLHLVMGLVCVLLPNVITLWRLKRQYCDDYYDDDLCWITRDRRNLLMKSITSSIIYATAVFFYRYINGNQEIIRLLIWGMFGILLSIFLIFDIDYLSRIRVHFVMAIIMAFAILLLWYFKF